MSTKQEIRNAAIKNHEGFAVINNLVEGSVEFAEVKKAIAAESNVQLVLDIAGNEDEVETHQASISVFVDDEQIQLEAVVVETEIKMSERELTSVEFVVLNHQIEAEAKKLAEQLQGLTSEPVETIWAD